MNYELFCIVVKGLLCFETDKIDSFHAKIQNIKNTFPPIFGYE